MCDRGKGRGRAMELKQEEVGGGRDGKEEEGKVGKGEGGRHIW